MKKVIMSIVCLTLSIAGSIPVLADVASSDETISQFELSAQNKAANTPQETVASPLKTFPPSVEQIEEVLNTFTYEDFKQLQKTVSSLDPNMNSRYLNEEMLTIGIGLFDEITNKLGYKFKPSSVKRNYEFQIDWTQLYGPLKQKVNKKKYQENIPQLANVVHTVMKQYANAIESYLSNNWSKKVETTTDSSTGNIEYHFTSTDGSEYTIVLSDFLIKDIILPIKDGTPVKYAYNWNEDMAKYASGEYDKSFMSSSDDWIFHKDDSCRYWIENKDGLKIKFNPIRTYVLSDFYSLLDQLGLKGCYISSVTLYGNLPSFNQITQEGYLRLDSPEIMKDYAPYDYREFNGMLKGIITNAEGKSQAFCDGEAYGTSFPNGKLEVVVPLDAYMAIYKYAEEKKASKPSYQEQQAAKSRKIYEEIAAGKAVGYNVGAVEGAAKAGYITFLKSGKGSYLGNGMWETITRYKSKKTGAVYEVVFDPYFVKSCKRIK